MDKNTLQQYAQKRINELQKNIIMESDDRYRQLYKADLRRWKLVAVELEEERKQWMI